MVLVTAFAIWFIVHVLAVIPGYWVLAIIAIIERVFKAMFAILIAVNGMSLVGMVVMVATAALEAVVVGAFLAPFRVLSHHIADDYGS